MLMETLISRGGYPVRYRINGFEYVFRRNDDGHFVCPVLSGDHRNLMIGTCNFRVYAPKEPAVEQHDVPMIATRPRMEASFMPKCVASSAVIQTLADASNRAVSVTVTEAVEPKRRGGRRRK